MSIPPDKAYIDGLEYGYNAAKMTAHAIRTVGLVPNREQVAATIEIVAETIKDEIDRERAK